MNSAILASASPLDHVYQWVYQKVHVMDPPGGLLKYFVPNGELTLVSNHIVMQVLAVLLLVLVIPRCARVRSTGDPVNDLTPRGLGNFFESICAYLRDTVARPLLGKYTDRFIPFIWTAFFYVLFINLLGLLPLEPVTRGLVRGVYPDAHHGIGGAATGNIWVTGSLAVCTLFMIVVNGLRLGRMHFIAHFCPGPLWLAPLLVPVEIIGLGAKIFALTVRLFANMVAGHVLLAVLLGFISTSYLALGLMPASGISFVIVIVCVAFNLLELFVAFLQAFIFTFLTTLFIGQAILFHDDSHGDAEHAASTAH